MIDVEGSYLHTSRRLGARNEEHQRCERRFLQILVGNSTKVCFEHYHCLFLWLTIGIVIMSLLWSRFWSRSRFTTTAQYGTLVNNIFEAFNSVLVESRGKPIITMLEEIRLYMMHGWAKNRKKVASYEGNICPKILTRYNLEEHLTRHWIPR